MAVNLNGEQKRAWENSSEYADIKKKFLNAQRTGDVNAYNTLNAQAEKLMSNYTKPTVQQPTTKVASANTVNTNPYDNAWKNSNEYKGLSNEMQNAYNTGNVNAYDGINARAEQSKANFIKNLTMQQSQPQQSNFDMQDFINKYVASMTGSINNSQDARDALILKQRDQTVSDQQAMTGDVNNQYTNQVKDINTNTYNANEEAKVRGVQRGIQYSNQQQGIESGLASRGIELKQTAQQERDTRLNNIKNKIAQIKSGAMDSLQASESQANSERLSAIANAQAMGTQRQWQLDDMQTQRQWQQQDKNDQWNREDALIKQGYSREDAVMDKQFNQQVDMYNMQQKDKEKFFNMDIEAKKEIQQMGQDFQIKMFNMDEASKEKFFNMDSERQKNILKLQQQHDFDMFGLNANQQERMFSLNVSQQNSMAQFDRDTRMAVLNANQTNAEKMLSLNNQAKYDFMMLDNKMQQDIMKKQWNREDNQMKAQIEAQAKAKKADFMQNWLMNSPAFAPYLANKDIFDKNSKTFDTWSKVFDSMGFTPNEQLDLIKGQYKPGMLDSILGNRLDWSSVKDKLGVDAYNAGIQHGRYQY